MKIGVIYEVVFIRKIGFNLCLFILEIIKENEYVIVGIIKNEYLIIY